MSVVIHFDQNVQKRADLLDRSLTVKSAVDPKNRFQQQLSVACYDTFQEQGRSYVCLPFSYYYQQCESLGFTKADVAKHHVQRRYKFEGELLQRQKDIKDQALEILGRTGSVLLCLHTGFGKTIFTLYLASRLGLKTIVLCHRSIIMQQWVDSASKYLPKCKVHVLSTSDTDFTDVDILVCNVINVSKLPRTVYQQFGLVIADEIHTICTAQFSKALFSLSPSYLIGLSATPFRSDGMDRLLELYVGPELITREMKRFFNAYKLKTNFVPKVEQTADGNLNWNSVLESQATSVQRNQLLCKLVWYFGNRNILLLVKRKDHALELKRMLLELGEEADCFIHTAKKVNYQCRVLIATYSKGGVGFDHPKLDMLITGADVEESFMQYLGRVFRRDDVVPIYVDLRDEMHTIVKHSRTRLNICKDVGATVRDFHKTFKAFEECTQGLY
jgi:superfamily II DNA or RNA helicase